MYAAYYIKCHALKSQVIVIILRMSLYPQLFVYYLKKKKTFNTSTREGRSTKSWQESSFEVIVAYLFVFLSITHLSCGKMLTAS